MSITDMAESQTVKAQLHPRERAVANRKLKERHGSYAARLQQICFTTIRIRLLCESVDGDADNEEAKVQNTTSQTEAALGAKFEILSRKKHPDVKCFVLFYNLVNILHAATKAKIQIGVFLSLGKATVATALDKMLCFPVSAFLSGKWERCEGGLYGNEEYKTCRAENSMWMPIQTIGEFGNSNKGMAENKSLQTAVIASSDVLSFVFHLN
jgi:hypothetical protein